MRSFIFSLIVVVLVVSIVAILMRRDESSRSSTSPYTLTTPPFFGTNQMVQQSSLTISLDSTFPDRNPDGSLCRANFETVARDTLEVVQRRFANVNPLDTRPIVCYASSEAVPRTSPTIDPKIIWIGLVIPSSRMQALDYSKFAYELAHELGHVMLDAHRTNGVIESICDAISYQALDDLTELWAKKYANFAPWKDFAIQFHRYRVARQNEHLSVYPAEIQSAIRQERWNAVVPYVKEHQKELDKNLVEPEGPYGLNLRSLNARLLLSRPVEWRAFRGIGTLTTPSPEQDGHVRFDLPLDLLRTPREVQEAIARFRS